MEWNEDTIARLRALWAEGHSTAEIGRRLGISKNAVVGKAHRLTLPPRPSPSRRGATAPAPTPLRRMTGSSLPPLPAARPAEAPAVPRRRPMPPAAPSLAVVRPAPVAAPARASRLTACCWPIGEPGTSSFRFCDDGALPGKPYCAAHAQLAYVKVRDRREEAA
jgi:GcrA cell cycle regulator